MEPMPTPAPESHEAMEPMPTPAPQSHEAMKPMPTPAPQSHEAMEPIAYSGAAGPGSDGADAHAGAGDRGCRRGGA